MTKTKNITVAVPEVVHYHARVYAAKHQMTLSGMVGYLLKNLPAVSRAVRKLLDEDPNFGSEDAPSLPRTSQK
jgi:hypothetical protein